MLYYIVLTDIACGPNEAPARNVLIRYPTKLQSGVKRSFQSAWFQQHDWLEYSEQADAVFCYPCRHFSISGSHSESDVAFTIKGFSKWKKAQYRDGGLLHTVSLKITCKLTSHGKTF